MDIQETNLRRSDFEVMDRKASIVNGLLGAHVLACFI